MDVDSCVGALESAPPAQLPGDADGTDRRAGPLGRPTATFGSARSSSTHATPPRLTSLFTPKMVEMAVIVRLRAPQIQPGLEAEAMRHSFPIARDRARKGTRHGRESVFGRIRQVKAPLRKLVQRVGERVHALRFLEPLEQILRGLVPKAWRAQRDDANLDLLQILECRRAQAAGCRRCHQAVSRAPSARHRDLWP